MIYQKYSGNIESWDRFGRKSDRKIMSYEEWEKIDDLLQKLEWKRKGISSKEVETRTEEEIIQLFDTQTTVDKLNELVGMFTLGK